MATAIDGFEITSYNEVKLKTNKGGHNVEHTFYSVPTSIIRKFINATKAPSVQDFEDWLSTARQKEEKQRDKDGVTPFCCGSFWSSKD
jgi:hypothetical protein